MWMMMLIGTNIWKNCWVYCKNGNHRTRRKDCRLYHGTREYRHFPGTREYHLFRGTKEYHLFRGTKDCRPCLGNKRVPSLPWNKRLPPLPWNKRVPPLPWNKRLPPLPLNKKSADGNIDMESLMNTLYQTLEDLENRNEYLSSENRAGYIPQSNIFWTQELSPQQWRKLAQFCRKRLHCFVFS